METDITKIMTMEKDTVTRTNALPDRQNPLSRTVEVAHESERQLQRGVYGPFTSPHPHLGMGAARSTGFSVAFGVQHGQT
jgi:hypothetical protein